MNFINPKLHFKNKSRKIKTRDIIIIKKKYINDISKQQFPFLKKIIIGNVY